MKFRKSFLIVLLILIATGLFVGCSGGNTNTAGEREPHAVIQPEEEKPTQQGEIRVDWDGVGTVYTDDQRVPGGIHDSSNIFIDSIPKDTNLTIGEKTPSVVVEVVAEWALDTNYIRLSCSKTIFFIPPTYLGSLPKVGDSIIVYHYTMVAPWGDGVQMIYGWELAQ